MIDDLFDTDELPVAEIYRTAQRVVKDYMNRECKKIEWVASQLGTTRGYLYASLDPHQTHKPLSVDRALEICRLTGDARIVEAMARELGYTLCKPGDLRDKGAEPMEVVVTVLGMEELHGDLAKTVKEAVKDGVLDEDEKEEIRKRAYELRKQAAELEKALG
ncbi:phage regulatory CII family protein [Nitratifractor salsuginis]|uniref:Uncharacterized protein n=1 Tax=Nitratifractor salsuginis (strain DSM 16511 / JCM 12458 / E9I37-1) TaxID=749222 RepID=E6X1Q7_NITSE|nr:phage regulatory CII family protein [Nitratifractor salsuginis]ADV47048.1 hypothetical protein Nitsa_1803 [Nitratifractor salsuginis DSM 16511]